MAWVGYLQQGATNPRGWRLRTKSTAHTGTNSHRYSAIYQIFDRFIAVAYYYLLIFRSIHALRTRAASTNHHWNRWNRLAGGVGGLPYRCRIRIRIPKQRTLSHVSRESPTDVSSASGFLDGPNKTARYKHPDVSVSVSLDF